MKADLWNPGQYGKFKQERAKPFWDLLHLVKPEGLGSAVDLGCGTGELTHQLAKRLTPAKVLGIDSSQAMLKESLPFGADLLEFREENIETFRPEGTFDLVFSNAALQWVPNHETLFPKVLEWVAPKGQVAIQIPYNFDHPSHGIAKELEAQFPVAQQPSRRPLPQERYAQILWREGFRDVRCRLEVYLHPMESGNDVVEWTKGTLLTSYQKLLSREAFQEFLRAYRSRLLEEIGLGPYIYPFKRLLLWGKRDD